MRSPNSATPLAIVCAAIAAVLIAYSCTADNAPVGPVLTAGTVTAAKDVDAAAGTNFVGNQRATEALAKFAWLGKVHNDALRDVFRNRVQWVGSDRSDVARMCGGLNRLVIQYSKEINARAGIAPSAGELWQTAKRAITDDAIGHQFDCRSANGMNIFLADARPFSSARSAIYLAGYCPDCTGGDDPPYQHYLDNLSSRVDASDGSPAAAQAIGQDVLSSASGLGTEDYDVVAAAVSLADSSSQAWTDYATENNCTSESCGPVEQQPMSLFLASISWKRGFIIDVVGCAAGARGGGWWGCGIWGVASSAMYAIAAY